MARATMPLAIHDVKRALTGRELGDKGTCAHDSGSTISIMTESEGLKSVGSFMPDLSNKAVLVTGGTGSFGQHFVRRLLRRNRLRRLVIFSRDELKQPPFPVAQLRRLERS